jgi:hypothetical protein
MTDDTSDTTTEEQDDVHKLTDAELSVRLQRAREQGRREGHDTRHNISESADKITLTTKVKRGSGTRDEDRIKIKVKGDDADKVVAKLNATVDNLQETADELRGLRAGENDE